MCSDFPPNFYINFYSQISSTSEKLGSFYSGIGTIIKKMELLVVSFDYNDPFLNFPNSLPFPLVPKQQRGDFPWWSMGFPREQGKPPWGSTAQGLLSPTTK